MSEIKWPEKKVLPNIEDYGIDNEVYWLRLREARGANAMLDACRAAVDKADRLEKLDRELVRRFFHNECGIGIGIRVNGVDYAQGMNADLIEALSTAIIARFGQTPREGKG